MFHLLNSKLENIIQLVRQSFHTVISHLSKSKKMKKTVLVSGATSGFGEACARLFASHGWKLIITGRRIKKLKQLQQELKTDCYLINHDVRDKKSVKKDLENIPSDYCDIDVLINNAGLALGLETADKVDIEDWETMVDTNIKGLMYYTHFLLPSMVQKNKGHIINMGSVAGNWPYPGGNTYGGTKAFVKQFSHNLRCDLHGTKIRVSNIEPGMAETEFSIIRFKNNVEKADNFYKGTNPLTGEDIADIIYWMVCQPEHVNINRIEVMPTSQSCGPFRVHRELIND